MRNWKLLVACALAVGVVLVTVNPATAQVYINPSGVTITGPGGGTATIPFGASPAYYPPGSYYGNYYSTYPGYSAYSPYGSSSYYYSPTYGGGYYDPSTSSSYYYSPTVGSSYYYPSSSYYYPSSSYYYPSSSYYYPSSSYYYPSSSYYTYPGTTWGGYPYGGYSYPMYSDRFDNSWGWDDTVNAVRTGLRLFRR